jgi:hypothetical protein
VLQLVGCTLRGLYVDQILELFYYTMCRALMRNRGPIKYQLVCYVLEKLSQRCSVSLTLKN